MAIKQPLNMEREGTSLHIQFGALGEGEKQIVNPY